MDFWATLKSVGIETTKKVSSPVFSGAGKAFENVVVGAQNKVSSVVTNFVDRTDPTRKESIPSRPPTDVPPPQSIAVQVAGAAQNNFQIILAAALVVGAVYFFTRGAK